MNLRRFDLWWERPGWTILNMWTGEDGARICRLDVIFDNYVSLSYSSISAGNLISTVCAFGGGEESELWAVRSLISMAAEHGFATRQPGATVWYSVVQCGTVWYSVLWWWCDGATQQSGLWWVHRHQVWWWVLCGVMRSGQWRGAQH